MAFEPHSYIKLCNVPIDKDGQNQIRFTSRAAQIAYFNSKVVKSYTNFTYIRKDNIIRVNTHIDQLWNVNYVLYENDNFTNRIFYAFVVNIEYISDACTALTIKTDVYQTWMLDCDLKNSFVVRCMEWGEQLPDYQPGTNLVDEGLETGEYIINPDTAVITTELNDLAIMVLQSDVPDGYSINQPFYMLNGMPTGLFIFMMENLETLADWVNQMTSSGKVDAIVSIYLVPKQLINRIIEI